MDDKREFAPAAMEEGGISKASTFLDMVPFEIREQILSHLLVTGRHIDITVSNCKRVRRRAIHPFFKQYLHGPGDIAILRVCKQTHEEGIALMWKQNKFFSSIVDSVSKLPDVMGIEETSLIQQLELKISFFMKVYPERQWPRKLEFFTTKMPSLKRFKLTTSFHANHPLMVEATGDSRFGQEQRALISFGAYLSLRHEGLNLLIWPADSGPTHEEDEGRIHAYIDMVNHRMMRSSIVVEKYSKAGDEVRETHKDIILNAKAIRRVAWDQLANMKASDFELETSAVRNDGTETSEGPETSNYFQNDADLIDQAGYLTTGAKWKKNVGRTPVVAELIQRAQVNVRKSEAARAKRVEEGKSREVQAAKEASKVAKSEQETNGGHVESGERGSGSSRWGGRAHNGGGGRGHGGWRGDLSHRGGSNAYRGGSNNGPGGTAGIRGGNRSARAGSARGRGGSPETTGFDATAQEWPTLQGATGAPRT